MGTSTVLSVMEWWQPSQLPRDLPLYLETSVCQHASCTIPASKLRFVTPDKESSIHFIWRHLYASMQVAQIPASKLRFITPDKESSINTLWQEEEFEQICSRESPTEKAAENCKNNLCERARKGTPLFWPDNVFWNSFSGIRGQME